MTDVLTAPVPPAIADASPECGAREPTPATLDAYRMQRLRSRDAGDHFAMYCAGFFVTCHRPTGEFYWDRREDRYIVRLTPEVADKARMILRKEVRIPLRFGFNSRTAEVLDRLQDRSIKPRSWVNAEVRAVYEELIEAGKAFTMEAFHEDALVGGLVGIAIGGVMMIETMYSLSEPPKLRSASKALLCHAAIEFERIGAQCIDMQTSHPKDHPCGRLGETRITMDELRHMLARQSGSPLDAVAAMMEAKEAQTPAP